MTTEQKRTILQRISDTQADIDTLRKTRIEVLKSGFASASISSGGGSKSYTRADAGKLTEAIKQLTAELKSLRTLLTNGTGKEGIKTIYTIYQFGV